MIGVGEKKRGKETAYLADIDKTTHQVLVGQGIDGILRLFTRCVLHNSVRLFSQ